MKPVWGLFLVKDQRQLKIVYINVEADIPLAHQLMDPLWKELPGLLLELLHNCSHDVFV